MLKLAMYQGLRSLSHWGRCWTSGISATSSGFSTRIAGIRNTLVAWYDWFRGVRTTKICATAAQPAKTMNVGQPGVCVVRCARNGIAAAPAASATRAK